MPECGRCGENEFELSDGFYYCIKCGFQCQDFREEVCEEIFSQQSALIVSRKRRQSDSLSNSNKRKKAAKEKKESSTSTELYNVVIVKQLDFLISIGIDSRIKLPTEEQDQYQDILGDVSWDDVVTMDDIVLQLWAKYLQMNELGFCGEYGNTNGWKPKLYRKPRQCDLKLWKLSHRKKKKPVKKKKNKNHKKKQSKAQLSQTDQESVFSDTEMSESRCFSETDLESLLDKANSDLSYYTSDAESSRIDISDAEMSDNVFEKKKYEKVLYSGASKNESVYSTHEMSRMKFSRTVSFCYLGLCMLGEANRYVTLGDILRWIREGHFPYMNMMDILAKDVELTEDNRKLFYIGIKNILIVTDFNLEISDFKSKISELEGIELLDRVGTSRILLTMATSSSTNKVSLTPATIKFTSAAFPKYQTVMKDAITLAKYLKLSKTGEKNPKYLIQKYVIELNLPTSIIRLAENLQCKRCDKFIGSWEIFAIVRIIFVLKQLFILDDISENFSRRLGLNTFTGCDTVSIQQSWKATCIATAVEQQEVEGVKDGNVESGQLPPCHNCLHLHAARANYQVAIWHHSLQADPQNTKSTGKQRWVLSDNGDLMMNPITGKPAPDKDLEFLSYEVKKFVWTEWQINLDLKCKLLLDNHFSFWSNMEFKHPEFIDRAKTIRYLILRSQQYRKDHLTKKRIGLRKFLEEIRSELDQIAELKESDEPQLTLLPWKYYTKFYCSNFKSKEISQMLCLEFYEHSIDYITNLKVNCDDNENYKFNEENASVEFHKKSWTFTPKKVNMFKNFHKYEKEISTSFLWLLNMCAKVTEIPIKELFYHLCDFESTMLKNKVDL
ncbi:TATA box-binding protein-associated factor RNA polymerase I subunit B [Nymphon striatum]|nr:TATA box-binding protein-associated factor RNA polymerase I subunit B [Nymphon striatum]